MRKKLLTFLSPEVLYGLGELRDRYISTIGRKRGKEEEPSNTSYRNAWKGLDLNKKLRKQLRLEKRRDEIKWRHEGTLGAEVGDLCLLALCLLVGQAARAFSSSR